METIWIVLSDGRKVQVYAKEAREGAPLTPLFESPLNFCQLLHELRWHYGDLADLGCSLREAVRALLVNGALKGYFQSLVLVAPPQVGDELKMSLPTPLQARIIQQVEKDLTHCHRVGISAYFSQLA